MGNSTLKADMMEIYLEITRVMEKTKMMHKNMKRKMNDPEAETKTEKKEDNHNH